MTLRCNRTRSGLMAVAPLLIALAAGCDRLDMYDQPRYEALEASGFFQDGLSARPMIEGTIPRGGLRDDDAFYLGKQDKELVKQIPMAAYRAVYDREPRLFSKSFDDTDQEALRHALLLRGKSRFEIYCSVCHGRLGDGNGMIVQRGFRKPPSYHIDRMQGARDGHFFEVITHGIGAMPSYASRVDVADRWAITAYIRALQLSQNASINDVPADERSNLLTPEGAR